MSFMHSNPHPQKINLVTTQRLIIIHFQLVLRKCLTRIFAEKRYLYLFFYYRFENERHGSPIRQQPKSNRTVHSMCLSNYLVISEKTKKFTNCVPPIFFFLFFFL